MYLLPTKYLFFLITLSSFHNVLPQVCLNVPTEPEPPELNDFNLDQLLADGTFYINSQSSKASTRYYEATFVFGNVGYGKSIVTPFLAENLDKLDIGLSEDNIPGIFRKDNYMQLNDSQKFIALLPDIYEPDSEDFGRAAYWDVPGFSFNTGSNADVAQVYFLNYVLEFTTSAKFIFTIKHSSLMIHAELENMTTYASILVWNLPGTIGLVVTDIQESTRGDEEILSEIRLHLSNFFELVNQTFMEKVSNREPWSEIEPFFKRRGFLYRLLEEADGERENSHFYFIRTPEKCEDLETMPSILDTVANLKKFESNVLRHANITTVQRQYYNFGYNLRTETFLKIEQALQDLDFKAEEQYATELSHAITTQLGKLINGTGMGMPNLERLLGFQESFERNFGGLTDRPRGFAPPWEGVMNDMDVFMTCASQRLKTIQFFVDVINAPYRGHTSEYAEPFQIISSCLSNLTTFYSFCNATYHTLGEPSYQRILINLNVYNHSLYHVNISMVLDFLEMAKIDIPDEIRAIWGSLGSKEKQHLVDIVQKQMSKFRVSCVQLVLEVKKELKCRRADFIGENVFVGDVIDWFTFNYGSNCCTGSGSSEPLGDRGTQISVIAKEKFHLDRDVVVMGRWHRNWLRHLNRISIVAPVWETHVHLLQTEESRVINMSSFNYFSNYLIHGGGFFGVFSEMSNSERLRIYANGGIAEYVRDYGSDSGTIYLVDTTGSEIKVYREALASIGSAGSGKNTTDIYKPAHLIVDFNAEFRDDFIYDCSFSLKEDEFFWKLRVNPELGYVYTPLFFVNELEMVERNFTNWKKGLGTPKCPEIVSTGLVEYYEKILNTMTKRMNMATDEKTRLGFWLTGSLLVSKLISERRLEKTLNVISTEKYLLALVEDLNVIVKLELRVAINRETEEYKGLLNDKVKEAEQLITTTIQPAIKRAEEALKNINLLLLKTVKAFVEAAKNQSAHAEKMRTQFSKMLPLKYAMSALSIVGTAVSFMGPVGSAVGGGLQAGASIGNSYLNGQGSMAPLGTFTKQLPDDSDKYWNDQIEKISPPKANDTQDMKDLRDKKAKWAQRLTLVAGTTATVLTALNEINSIGQQSNEMDQAVAAANAQVKRMQDMKDRFEKDVGPALDNMTEQITKEAQKLNGTSHAGLTVKKFGLKNQLKKMREQVRSFAGPISEAQNNSRQHGQEIVGEPLVFERFLGSIETLEEALVVLFEMYTHIETYEERKQHSQFIANINSPSTAIASLADKALIAKLKDFELVVRTNLLLEEYKKAEHAFKQFVFPFARDYLKRKDERFGLTNNSKIAEVLEVCRREIRNFISIIQKDNAITTTSDEFVFHENFTSGTLTSRPFFVWTNEKWNSSIHQLFQGEAIRLLADCNMTGHENEEFFVYKGAIKFKIANLFIRTHDQSLQEDLNEVLKHFQLSMTHSGLSLYMVNQQQFVLRDVKQTYIHNFEHQISQNVVRVKVSGPNSDFLMSPYTWWTLQLTDVTGEGFENLKEFNASGVDLVLQGSGSYLDEKRAGNAFLEELRVSDYYEPFDSETEANKSLDQNKKTAGPPTCNQAQFSNIQLDNIVVRNVTPSDELEKGRYESEYDYFTKGARNNDIWQERFDGFQERSKTRFPAPFQEEPREREVEYPASKDEEPSAQNVHAAEVEEDNVPAFKPDHRQVSEENEEREKMGEEIGEVENQREEEDRLRQRASNDFTYRE